MSDDVNIKISATDNATATLRAVQAQLNGFSASVKNIAAFTVAGLGVQQVGSFLAGTLKEYAEAEKSQTRLQSVLKATGNTTKLTFNEINSFTDQLEKTTGTSGESLNDAAANLSRFANITGEQFKDVLTLANDMSKVLGSDVTSNVQVLAKALNSPAEGLSRLSRLGISFNDVQKQQIEMLDQVGEKAEAQAKILDEIRRQFGGAGADFGKTTAGQLEILNARIGDLKEAIGGALAPTVLQLVDKITAILGIPNGPAGRADELLANSRIGGVSQEQQRLTELRRLQEELRAERERNLRIVADIAQNPLRSAFSPLRNAAAIQGLAGSSARIDAIDKALRDQNARIVQALQTAIAAVPVDVVSGAVSRVFSDMASAATGATTGALMERFAAVNAQDAGAALGLQVRGMFFGPNWWQQQQQQQDRALQATESRFLTRGRGTLSPEAKKQAEDNAKQLAQLKRIEDVLKQRADNTLIVEGVN